MTVFYIGNCGNLNSRYIASQNIFCRRPSTSEPPYKLGIMGPVAAGPNGSRSNPHSPNQEQQTEIGVIETVKEFDLNIVERKLTLDPPIISVDVGDKILLRIQSDEELMFHIHEYDHEIMIIPGKIEELSFPATIPGRFEMEV